MKKKIVTLVLVIGLLTLSQPVFSYEAPFHKIMTEEAVNSSGLDNYLKNNLGFEKGFKQEFNGPGSVEALVCPQIEQEKTVTEWVKFGSWKEDHPDGSNEVQAYARMARRTVTHFYDPLSGEGLSDNVGPLIWAVVPSINWAYSHSDHEYSWTKARDYYELALTSQNEEDRNTNFAKTFRALGQVLHLLEDKTVPAHVRNDNHFPLLFGPDMYEEYWKADKAFPTFSYPIANLPIFRDYWDDDSGKGLAEFTNHNFLSRDTNFYDYGHQPLYPFPSFGNVSGAHEEPFTFTGSDGIKKTVDVYYYHWLVEDNYQSSSEENKYLTAHSYWDFESMEKDFIHVFSLNNVCHKAYGEYLLPRAVGYSAGLVDYFFRGELDVEIGPSTTPGYYKGTITNNSTETMNGEFRAFWDNTDGVRTEITYSSILPIITELVPNESVSVEIPISVLPPEISEAVTFTAVFRGTLGEEQGAVVGKIAPPVVGIPVWFEGWESAEVRIYEGRYDKINGDSGIWDTTTSGVIIEVDSSKKLTTEAELQCNPPGGQIPGTPVGSVRKSHLNIPVTKPNTMFSGDNSSNFDLGGTWFEPTEGGPTSWAQIYLQGGKKVNGQMEFASCRLFFAYSPAADWKSFEPGTHQVLGSGPFSIDLYDIFTDGSLSKIEIWMVISPSGLYNSREQVEYNQGKVVSITAWYDNLMVTFPSQ